MTDLFQYVPGNSPLHRMNPVTKIFLTLCICVAAFLTDNLFFLLFLLAFDLLIGVVAGAARKAFTIFRGLVKVSLFLFVLQALFVRRGNRLFWIITDEGLLTAASVVLRLLVVCLPLALVLTVTQVSDIANAMVQVLHVPYAYAFTLTTAIRFIPQFMEEMSGIMEAQTARGVEFDSKNFVKKLGMLLPLCTPLLISSVRRTGATATAAEVRGFDLRTRTSGYKRYGFGLIDLAALIVSAALIAGAVLMGTGWIPGSVANAGRTLSRLICRFKGERTVSPMLESMVLGGNAKAFPEDGRLGWLSKRRQNVVDYEADPLCGFPFTAGAYRDFMTVLSHVAAEDGYDGIRRTLPILVISGELDPVGGKAAVEKVAGEYRSLEFTDVTAKICPGDRHEILNEDDRAEVMAYLADWIAARVK